MYQIVPSVNTGTTFEPPEYTGCPKLLIGARLLSFTNARAPAPIVNGDGNDAMATDGLIVTFADIMSEETVFTTETLLLIVMLPSVRMPSAGL